MTDEERETNDTQISLAAQDMIRNISGAYCSNFWDTVFEVSGTLDTVREINDVVKTLHMSENSKEALKLIVAIHDLAGIETPAEILDIQPYPEATKIFIGEFIEDTEDLMYDYEAEENPNVEWN
jgi:hypothetical protein